MELARLARDGGVRGRAASADRPAEGRRGRPPRALRVPRGGGGRARPPRRSGRDAVALSGRLRRPRRGDLGASRLGAAARRRWHVRRPSPPSPGRPSEPAFARLRAVYLAVATWLIAWGFALALLASPRIVGGAEGVVVGPGRIAGVDLTPTVHYELGVVLVLVAVLGTAVGATERARPPARRGRRDPGRRRGARRPARRRPHPGVRALRSARRARRRARRPPRARRRPGRLRPASLLPAARRLPGRRGCEPGRAGCRNRARRPDGACRRGARPPYGCRDRPVRRDAQRVAARRRPGLRDRRDRAGDRDEAPSSFSARRFRGTGRTARAQRASGSRRRGSSSGSASTSRSRVSTSTSSPGGSRRSSGRTARGSRRL